MNKIEKIKKKYKCSEITDDVAIKISNLEIVKNIMVIISIFVGIVTILDLIIPDPIFLIDEAVFLTITAIFSSISAIIDRKINELLKTGFTSLTIDDVKEIGGSIMAAKITKKNL